MVNIQGKKIIVFSPYGATKHIGQAIITELKLREAIVYDYDERPSQNAWMKIIIRLFKKRIPQIFDKYISKIIKAHIGEEIDYIIICRGEAFTPYIINHLREAFQGVQVILYLWDVMHNCPMDDVISSCDKVLSFDPEDAKKHNLYFRPLFYINDYLGVKDASGGKYDLSFIGTLYNPRHLILKKMIKSFESQGINFFIYLYVPGFLMYVKEFITNFPFMPLKKVCFSPLTLKETIDILNESKAILDLNPPYQTSLSSRAHEAMAARRKYITTNKHIKDYEYYNPNNIFVIDADNPIIPKVFFESPFESIPAKILYKYSVKGLVDDFFVEF